MIGQAVLCRASGQAFELPPDHCGERVACPFCGADHPAPPIIPPPAERAPIVAGPPPVAESRGAKLLRATALVLTFACGLSVGILAGLAIAAATDSPARHSRQREAQALELARENAAEAKRKADQAAQAREDADAERSLALDLRELDQQLAIDQVRAEFAAREKTLDAERAALEKPASLDLSLDDLRRGLALASTAQFAEVSRDEFQRLVGDSLRAPADGAERFWTAPASADVGPLGGPVANQPAGTFYAFGSAADRLERAGLVDLGAVGDPALNAAAQQLLKLFFPDDLHYQDVARIARSGRDGRRRAAAWMPLHASGDFTATLSVGDKDERNLCIRRGQ